MSSYILDFFKKKKLREKNSSIISYEIRIVKNKRVEYILGFFDINNNFVFLNFHNFFHFFFSSSFNYKLFFYKFSSFEFIFFILYGFRSYIDNGYFGMNAKMYLLYLKKVSKLIRKIILKNFERTIKGFSWGKILHKQNKLIFKIDNERRILF